VDRRALGEQGKIDRVIIFSGFFEKLIKFLNQQKRREKKIA
jgi:inhibitor of KinA sporulation pathway (predicted exonuclease)